MRILTGGDKTNYINNLLICYYKTKINQIFLHQGKSQPVIEEHGDDRRRSKSDSVYARWRC